MNLKNAHVSLFLFDILEILLLMYDMILKYWKILIHLDIQ